MSAAPLGQLVTERTPLSVTLIDDHPLTNAGFACLLESHRGIDVVRFDPAAERTVDLALFDWFAKADSYPYGVLPLLADPRIERVAVYTWWYTEALAEVARGQGVAGYLSKRLDGEALAEAVVRAATGPEMVVASVREDGAGLWPVPEAGLTDREVEVLAMLVDGRTNRDIAAGLYVSVDTVKSHLKTIYRKLGVANRTQAVVRALDTDF